MWKKGRNFILLIRIITLSHRTIFQCNKIQENLYLLSNKVKWSHASKSCWSRENFDKMACRNLARGTHSCFKSFLTIQLLHYNPQKLHTLFFNNSTVQDLEVGPDSAIESPSRIAQSHPQAFKVNKRNSFQEFEWIRREKISNRWF